MGTVRRQRFAQATMWWLLAMVFVVIVIGGLSLELFYIISLFGFLVIVELTAPSRASPEWRRKLVWFVVVGLGGFAFIVLRRAVFALPPDFTSELFGLVI